MVVMMLGNQNLTRLETREPRLRLSKPRENLDSRNRDRAPRPGIMSETETIKPRLENRGRDSRTEIETREPRTRLSKPREKSGSRSRPKSREISRFENRDRDPRASLLNH